MKGISAFVATVLVIAFAVGVGVLIGPWIYSLTQTQTKTVGEESETRLECGYGGIRIIDASIKCNFTSSPKMLNFTLENTGTINLYNFTSEIYQTGLIYSYSVNDSMTNTTFTKDSPLKPAQKRTVSVNLNTSQLSSANPDWIRIVVPRCPTVADKVTNVTC